MKESKIFFIITLFISVGVFSSLAQVPDTVTVEANGSVEQAVTENPGKVIKLRRGSVYYIYG